MTKIADLKARWMTDPEFRAAYDEADREFAAIEAAIRAPNASQPGLSGDGNDSQSNRPSTRKD